MTKTARWWYLFVLVSALLLPSGGGLVHAAAAFAPVPDISRLLTGENLGRLEKGEVIKENETFRDAGGNDRGRAVALVLIHAPMDKVIEAIDDFETYLEWMPNVERTEVLLRKGNRRDVTFVLDVLWNEVKYTCIHRIDPARGVFEWRMDDSKEKKNVADSTGAWVMKSLGENKTAVAYTVLLDTGIAIPGFIEEYLAGSSLPKVAKALKDRVEGRT